MARTRERPPQLRALLDDELVVDLFAGGGGASCGIERALEGRKVDIAINHDPVAMAVHQKNHPETKHFVSNVWEVDPRMACGRKRVGLLWASPDCTYHSRARGGKPLERKNGSKRRALASVVIRWAKTVRPRVIVLENVREFEDWGPLKADGTPDKSKAGRSFRCWVGKLRAQGYVVEWRNLVAADYGTPTTRKRLFLIARRDRMPIVWPEPTHGPGRDKPWRSAAEILRFDRLGKSIFNRPKPLADATLRRIAAGLERYVLRGRPFIVPVTHQGDARVHDVGEPLRTVTAAHRGEFALCQYVVRTAHGEQNAKDSRQRWGRGHAAVEEPLGTVCASGTDFALCQIRIDAAGPSRGFVAPVMLRAYGGGENGTPAPPTPVTEPTHTITTQDHHWLAAAWLVKLYGTAKHGAPVTAPLPAITTGGERGGGHAALVYAFLVAYYSGGGQTSEVTEPLPTVVTKDRFGLVTVTIDGETFVLYDVLLRMLDEDELAGAMGFDENYDLSPATTKGKRVALIGNSVCQQVAEAIVRANMPAPVGQLGLFQGAAA